MAVPILTLHSVSRYFDSVRAVDDLSLSVDAGKITALIGPNGSGKTTVLNLVSGLLRPDTGEIRLHGKRISGRAPHAIARRGVGRTFQQIRLCPQMSVIDNVQMAFASGGDESLIRSLSRPTGMLRRDSVRRDRALELLERFGLVQKADAMGSELSHGQRRMVELARALALRPQILLLDEPLSGLAPAMVMQMLSIIGELCNQGNTVLFIEHNVRAVLEVSDWVIVLDHGEKIAEGTPEQIRQNPQVIAVYLGKGAASA